MKKHVRLICSFLMVTLLVTLYGVAAGGTVAHWDFEEGTVGSIAVLPDSIIDSANGLDGTPYGGPVYEEVGGPYGSMGLHFDGVNDRISIEDDPLFAVTSSLTLEAIIVYEGTSAGSEYFNLIVFRGDDRGGHDPYFLGLALDGRLAFAVGNATGERSLLFTASPLAIGQPLHVAGTLNDATGEQKLYINGSEVASTITDIRPFAALDPGFDPGLGIGNAQNSEWDMWFDGTICEVRISDQALMPNEFLPEPALVIAVDIKPTSCPNPLNVKSKGVLPVAILGSDVFDVGDIDIASIRFEGVAPAESAYEDVASPVLDQTECSCTTDGPDGYMDLTLKFETQEIMAILGEVYDGEIWLLYLTGSLHDGTEIEGSDCMRIIKKGN